MACVACFLVLRCWVRLLLETLDIKASHSCACKCIAMAIICACFGSVLHVRASGGGFFLNDISWAISARVRV